MCVNVEWRDESDFSGCIVFVEPLSSLSKKYYFKLYLEKYV